MCSLKGRYHVALAEVLDIVPVQRVGAARVPIAMVTGHIAGSVELELQELGKREEKAVGRHLDVGSVLWEGE